MIETAEVRPVRFAGVYRSDRFGVVGLREASLMNAICRNGWRKDSGKGITEGVLAQLCLRKIGDQDWKEAIARLVSWGFIVIDAATRNALTIRLTQRGKDEAIELCANRARDDKSHDGEEDIWKS